MCYQRVVVGKGLGDEDIVELLHKDPLAVEAFQVYHGELLQVVCPETVERDQQQRRRMSSLAGGVSRRHGSRQESQQQPDTSQES